MIIEVDCDVLNEQIQLLDMYYGVITDKHKKGLVEGIANILSEINFAVETNEDISFEKYEEE